MSQTSSVSSRDRVITHAYITVVQPKCHLLTAVCNNYRDLGFTPSKNVKNLIFVWSLTAALICLKCFLQSAACKRWKACSVLFALESSDIIKKAQKIVADKNGHQLPPSLKKTAEQ